MATNPEISTEKKAAEHDVNQEPNDASATTESEIAAKDADRFAETFRPSWVQSSPIQIDQKDAVPIEKGSTVEPDGISSMPQSSFGREDTEAELKLAAATITSVKKVRKKILLWTGGVAACLFVLIAFSGMTQKEQETSLWENKQTSKPTPVESASKEPIAVASSSSKAGTKLPTASSAEPTVNTIRPSANRVEEPPAASERTAGTESAQAAEQPNTNPAAEQSEQNAAEPPKVRIQVTTLPAKAKLTLDGSSVSNPFDQALSKTGKHLFVARANGYSKKYRQVEFDRDRKLLLRLTRKKAKSRTMRRGSRKKTASRRRRVSGTSRRTTTPNRSTSQAKRSHKGFTSENPY